MAETRTEGENPDFSFQLGGARKGSRKGSKKASSKVAKSGSKKRRGAKKQSGGAVAQNKIVGFRGRPRTEAQLGGKRKAAKKASKKASNKASKKGSRKGSKRA